MTKIKRYVDDTELTIEDKLIGTDSDGGSTRNYPLFKIAKVISDYVNLQIYGLVDKAYVDSKDVETVKYKGASPSTMTLGGIPAGTVLTNKSFTSLFQELLVVYLTPYFKAAPEVVDQPSTVEVGTILSGNRTFNWSTINSGNVAINSIAIRDFTSANALLASGLANDGTESVLITTKQLNTAYSVQIWRMEMLDTNGIFNVSQQKLVTANYVRYSGPSTTSVTNSASVKALVDHVFQTANANTFILNTGNQQAKFTVALPPERTISEVVDLDALNAVITSNYVLTGTINVQDAGATNRLYNIYEMNIGEPYSANHRHEIKTV